MTSKSMVNVSPVQSMPSPHAVDLAKSDQTIERLKRLYNADVQAEYLYLKAETDSLFRELEAIKHKCY
ncbi:MAG: hypothetical protein AAGF24_05955 [Cyanobacteria bacterium P01_H01_bin.121]